MSIVLAGYVIPVGYWCENGEGSIVLEFIFLVGYDMAG